MIGRVASDDAEAVKAINAEIRELIGNMETGIRKVDVSAIRDAATKARDLGQMLTPDAAARVNVAIEAARKIATAFVKAGDTAATEIDSRVLQTLAEARTAFLDLDGPDAEAVAIPEAESRAVDFEPTAAPSVVPAAQPAMIDLG